MHLPVAEWLEWLRSLYDQYGYLVVFLSALAENTAVFGLFMPGATLVLLGAFYARQGELLLPLVIFWGTVGTIVGYHLDFLFGRYILAGIINRWSGTRWGKRLRLAGRVRLSRMLVAKHGGKAILISHVAGHIRSFVAMSAGMMRMRYRTFLLFEIIAATLWNTIYALVGYSIAVDVHQLELLLQRMGITIFIVVLVILLLWHFVKARVARQVRITAYSRRKKKEDEKVAL